MAAVLVVIRLSLAAIFAVAGFAKLADPAGSRRAVRDFGVPGRLAAPLGFVLPIAEIGIAAGLVPAASARFAAGAGAGLLVLFAVAISIALLRGRRPDCHCFGQLHSAPAGPATLARNAALAGLATVIAARGPGAAVGAVDPAATVAAAAVALLLLESAVLVALLRRHGHVLAQLDELRNTTALEEAGLPIGTPAPSFTLESATGELISLDDLLARGLPVVLTFVDRGCGPCAALLPELAGWQEEHADCVTVAIVGRGDAEANRATAEEHGISLLLVDDGDVAAAYGSAGTPSAVVVDPDGRVATRLSYGADRIRALVVDQLELEPEAVLTGV
jgi:peroxiredoxin/uncharacterized membrane protein YphA (DoxX/SURF4 family)